MYWLNLKQKKDLQNLMLRQDAIPEQNRRTFQSEKQNCSFTYCKYKENKKSLKVLFKKNKYFVQGKHIPSSEKAWRYQNELYPINNLDQNTTKKACLILLILQMRKKHICYELTWKGLCMVGRWRTRSHTALLQNSCRGEAALLELEQFKKKTGRGEI